MPLDLSHLRDSQSKNSDECHAKAVLLRNSAHGKWLNGKPISTLCCRSAVGESAEQLYARMHSCCEVIFYPYAGEVLLMVQTIASKGSLTASWRVSCQILMRVPRHALVT